VSTPSDVSLQDARKAIEMSPMKVDIVGMVENMSYFAVPTAIIRRISSRTEAREKTAQQVGWRIWVDVQLDPNPQGWRQWEAGGARRRDQLR